MTCGLVTSSKQHCTVSSSVMFTARRTLLVLSWLRENIATGRRREVEKMKEGNTNSHEDEMGLK
jgi:hypothetical protein